jgi:DNA-directed RNA polymerase specialized sigma24 family protein
MKRRDVSPGQAERWRTLFNTHRPTLTAVAEMLSHSSASPEQILDEAAANLEGSSVRDPFAQVAAIRAVVKAAIAHNREAATSRIEAELPDPAQHAFSGDSLVGMLPWRERAVYFLREVLRYSRRNTALLLGMSDADIDQIYELARRRISDSYNTSFRWLTDGSNMAAEIRSDRPIEMSFQEGPLDEFQLLFQGHRGERSEHTIQL